MLYKARSPDYSRRTYAVGCRSRDYTTAAVEVKYALSPHVQKMLLYNPGKRINAKAALVHPYFDDLDKSTLPAAHIS